MTNGEQLIVTKSAHYYRFWLVAALLAALIGAVTATAAADAPRATVTVPRQASKPSATPAPSELERAKLERAEAGEKAHRYCRGRMNSYAMRLAGRAVTLKFTDGFVVGEDEDGQTMARVDGHTEPVLIGKDRVYFTFTCVAQSYDPRTKSWGVTMMSNGKHRN